MKKTKKQKKEKKNKEKTRRKATKTKIRKIKNTGIIMIISLVILVAISLFYLIPVAINLCVSETLSILECKNREECVGIIARETKSYGTEQFVKKFISCEETCKISNFRVARECKEDEFSLSIKTNRAMLFQIKKLSNYFEK